MSGTTLCPHCDTRFKIAQEQLEAHQGLVRCGHCMQAFDARANFIPTEPDPQLELPIAEETPAEALPETPVEQVAVEESAAEEIPATTVASLENHPEVLPVDSENANLAAPLEATGEADAAPETNETPADNTLDFIPPAPANHLATTDEATPLDATETVAEPDEIAPVLPKQRKWLWLLAAPVLVFLILAQAAFFWRVELAAHLPSLKPALIVYCNVFGRDVPLPQNGDKMSIESSDLEADPNQENRITLNALLRNRDTGVQAFPNLELTLNDAQDKPMARRILNPADYLPPAENEKTGLLPNHELNVKLPLDTTDLKPSGYRLVLFYSAKN